jgi:hypothetical protein
MSSKIHKLSRVAALAALTALSSQSLAQSDDADPELRIQRLEEQLRQLTGQNEELQYRNRQLEERLRQLQGGVSPAPALSAAQPGAATVPTQSGTVYNKPQAQPGYPQPQSGYGQPQQGYGQPQIAAPAPIVQEPPTSVAGVPRRGDAFDPALNPNAPGAPRALGGGQMPIGADTAIGAPGGRAPGEPLNLANTAVAPTYRQGNMPGPPAGAAGAGGLVTAPPSNKPRDEYDLGIGYM